jgi:hypothetical protein
VLQRMELHGWVFILLFVYVAAKETMEEIGAAVHSCGDCHLMNFGGNDRWPTVRVSSRSLLPIHAPLLEGSRFPEILLSTIPVVRLASRILPPDIQAPRTNSLCPLN